MGSARRSTGSNERQAFHKLDSRAPAREMTMVALAPCACTEATITPALTFTQGVPRTRRLQWHRFYTSQLGRFVSRDPLGYASGMNFFQYVSSEPINRTDPSGLHPLVHHTLIYACIGWDMCTTVCWGDCYCAYTQTGPLSQFRLERAMAAAIYGCCFASCKFPGFFQPARMRACLQIDIRKYLGPGVSCHCT